MYSIVRFGRRAQVRLGPADALAGFGLVKRSFMSRNRHGKKRTVAASARRHPRDHDYHDEGCVYFLFSVFYVVVVVAVIVVLLSL